MAKKTGLASAVKKRIDPEQWIKQQPKTTTEGKPARLVVDLPADLHRQLKGKCGVEGRKIKDVKDVIHELLEQYLAGNIKNT